MFIVEICALGLLCQRFPRGKVTPVLHVVVLGSTPVVMASLERVLWPNDFSFEKCSQGRVLWSQPWTSQKVPPASCGNAHTLNL